LNNTCEAMQGPMFAASSDGCAVGVWQAGNPCGPAVLLLHGFSLDHTIWDRVCADPELNRYCHLVAPDLRGHGLSGHPTGPASYSDGTLWADDLEAVIRLLGLREPVVVAWSYAGRMVNDYLRKYGSTNLAGINYVAAATLSDVDTIGPAHPILADLCSSQPERVGKACARFVQEVLGQAPGTPEYEQLSQMLGQTPAHERAWLRNRILDYDPLLAELQIPVLASHGSGDTVVLPALADKLVLRLPQCRASLYEDAGHAPFMDAPVRFCRELLAFTKELNPA
jgi:non-heme chloroperoxidase